MKAAKKALKVKTIFFISAAINDGVPNLMKETWRVFKELSQKRSSR